MSIETNFGLLNFKKKNIWFALKSCSCAQKACQEAFQAHYSFGKLGGYKVCIVANTMKLKSNVGVSKAL